MCAYTHVCMCLQSERAREKGMIVVEAKASIRNQRRLLHSMSLLHHWAEVILGCKGKPVNRLCPRIIKT